MGGGQAGSGPSSGGCGAGHTPHSPLPESRRLCRFVRDASEGGTVPLSRLSANERLTSDVKTLSDAGMYPFSALCARSTVVTAPLTHPTP